MIDVSDFFSDNRFTNRLLRTIPCGLLICDQNGRLLDINHATKRLFGANKVNTGLEANFGNVLNCLNAFENPVGCGNKEECDHCKIRKLALKSIAMSAPLESTTQLQIVSKGKVKDTLLSISATPYDHSGKKICFLIIKNLRSNERLDEEVKQTGFHGIVGQSKNMLDVFDTIRQIRTSDDPVLLQGESGTGKELVALAIHRESRRADKHLVPVNCGALPEGLLESEMFGHVKGAFTGATFNKKGRFKIADKGTIFLDEISELNLSMQARFLRIIESGTYEPVGSDQSISVDVRVISATNSFLEKEIKRGQFRSDLYYRLCVIPILLPPLRERKDDIPLLAEYFLKNFAEKSNQRKLALSKKAVATLKSYSWPGNVRELQNILKYTVLKCQDKAISPEHFPYYIFNNNIQHIIRRQRKQKLKFIDVVNAMQKCKGNKRLAAEVLGVSRSTLYRFFDRQKTERADS